MKSQFIVALLASAMFAGAANASQSGVRLDWTYFDVGANRPAAGSTNVELVDSTEKMKKTLMVVKMSDQITVALKAFEDTVEKNNACKDQPEIDPRAETRGRPIPGHPGPGIPERPPQQDEFKPECKALIKAIADDLQKGLVAYSSALTGVRSQGPRDADKLVKLEENVRDLVKMIREAKPQRFRGGLEMAMRSAAPVSITSGGATDAAKFHEMITRKQIPTPKDYQAYGLIKEFDLAVEAAPCSETMCLSPVVSIDQAKKKMYMQLNPTSRVVDESQIQRRPLNIGVCLDVSGSMGTTDTGDNQPRLYWAKKAIGKTLSNLTIGQDYFSLVWFSGGFVSNETSRPQAGILWEPRVVNGKIQPVSEADIEEIRGIVEAQQTRDATNLNAGLTFSYNQLNKVKDQLGNNADKFEHRILMITDANLNYDRDDGKAIIQAQKQSRENGINLTTVAVGQDFFVDFVNKLSVLRGGNFIYASNASAMMDYFNRFNFLVQPVAYDFLPKITYDRAKATLVRAHGVPTVDANDESLNKALGIETLFFTSRESGGGAWVLEFNLQ